MKPLSNTPGKINVSYEKETALKQSSREEQFKWPSYLKSYQFHNIGLALFNK